MGAAVTRTYMLGVAVGLAVTLRVAVGLAVALGVAVGLGAAVLVEGFTLPVNSLSSVLCPALPSAVRPLADWKFFTAVSVAAPKEPRPRRS